MKFKERVIRLKEVDSTNTYAKEILKKFPDIAEGTSIVAGFQTAGIGQDKNRWESYREENILLSTILHPDFLKPEHLFYLNISVALAVMDLLEYYGVENRSIKWPNDIYVGNRKIAGILIYNDLEMNFIRNTVIGLGININQEHFGSDIPNPVSLKNILKKDTDLGLCIEKLLDLLEERYHDLKNADFEKRLSEYHRSLFLLGQESMFFDNIRSEEFQGIIDGVRTDGRIRIITPQGIRYFEFREVKYIF